MTTLCALITLVLMGSGFETSFASDIVFQGDPNMIHTYLTSDLKLHCGLNDSASAGDAALIGRDVTHTDEHVLFVTSVVVTRHGGEHVASVTQVSPAQGLVDLDSIHVAGAVTGQGERAYLDVSWDYPTEHQSGTYLCEINAITDDGHGVVFSTSLMVNFSTPTLTDLVNYIRDVTVATKLKDDQIMALIDQKDQQIANISAQVAAKDQQISDIMDMINSSHIHVDNGTVSCGDSTLYRLREGSYKYKYVDVRFHEDFHDTPIVHLGIVNFRNMYHSSMTYANDYAVDIVRVDKSGFRIKCKTYNQSYNHVYILNVNWIGISEGVQSGSH